MYTAYVLLSWLDRQLCTLFSIFGHLSCAYCVRPSSFLHVECMWGDMLKLIGKAYPYERRCERANRSSCWDSRCAQSRNFMQGHDTYEVKPHQVKFVWSLKIGTHMFSVLFFPKSELSQNWWRYHVKQNTHRRRTLQSTNPPAKLIAVGN